MRGRTVRKLLLPHILRLFIMGLVVGSLILTLLLMVRLAVDLMNETNRLNTAQLSIDQVLHHMKHFLILSLFGAIELFGASTFTFNDDKTFRSTLFGWCSLLCGLFLLIDALLTHASIAVGIFMIIQGLLVALQNIFLPINDNVCSTRQSSNVHYIQMPSEIPVLIGRKKPKFLPF